MRTIKVVSPNIIGHDILSGSMALFAGMIVACVGGVFAMTYTTTLLLTLTGFGGLVMICGAWTIFKTQQYARCMRIIQGDRCLMDASNIRLSIVEIPVKKRLKGKPRFELKRVIKCEGTIAVGGVNQKLNHYSILTEEPQDLTDYTLRIYGTKNVENCVILEVAHLGGRIVG